MTNSPFDDNSDFTGEKTVWTGSGESGVVSTTSGAVRKYLPGDVVDNSYQLLKLLGRGGMGVVFSCKHLVLGKTYALKVLSGEKLTNEHWLRFQAEAKSLARLNHNGIVGIHNMGIDQGLCPYLVMDLLSGESLDVLLRKEEYLPVDLALKLFIGLADALSCAHQHGIVHRDIKPGNLMVIRDSQDAITMLKLMDFGIARLTAGDGVSQSQTATGAVFGTPFYMSPEQIEGGKVDERSDIYSFGCTLFEVLTGRPPFVGVNPFETFSQHQTMQLPSLASIRKNVEFPESLELCLQKLLAKKTAERYQTMKQVCHDLERVLARRPILDEANKLQRSGSLTGGFSTGPLISMSEPLRDDEEVSSSLKSGEGNLFRIMALVALCVIVLAAGVGYAFYSMDKVGQKPSEKVLAKVAEPAPANRTHTSIADVNIGGIPLGAALNELAGNKVDYKLLQSVGATAEEIRQIKKYNWQEALSEQEKFADDLAKLQTGLTFGSSVFNIGGERTRNLLHFPEQLVIGYYSINKGPVLPAAGLVKVTDDASFKLFLTYRTSRFPEILEFLPPERINGIEVVVQDVPQTLVRLNRLTKLKEISLFSTLTKALPGFEEYDESRCSAKELSALDQFPQLEDLGLCGSNLTGKDLLKLKVVRRVKTLKLKRVMNLSPLLKVLEKENKLRELWIVGTPLTDQDLKLVAQIGSIETLRIRRSQLTPASVATLKRMPNLKHLILDRPWLKDYEKDLSVSIGKVEFEPVTDLTYWKLVR